MTFIGLNNLLFCYCPVCWFCFGCLTLPLQVGADFGKYWWQGLSSILSQASLVLFIGLFWMIEILENQKLYILTETLAIFHLPHVMATFHSIPSCIWYIFEDNWQYLEIKMKSFHKRTPLAVLLLEGPMIIFLKHNCVAMTYTCNMNELSYKFFKKILTCTTIRSRVKLVLALVLL